MGGVDVTTLVTTVISLCLYLMDGAIVHVCFTLVWSKFLPWLTRNVLAGTNLLQFPLNPFVKVDSLAENELRNSI